MNTPHISNDPKFAMAPADSDKRDNYRRQATQMFGNTNVPAVLYKGVTYPPRSF